MKLEVSTNITLPNRLQKVPQVRGISMVERGTREDVESN